MILLIWIQVGQEPTVLLQVELVQILFSDLLYLCFLPISETAQYRLKYCLTELLSPKKTNQKYDMMRQFDLIFELKMNLDTMTYISWSSDFALSHLLCRIKSGLTDV